MVLFFVPIPKSNVEALQNPAWMQAKEAEMSALSDRHIWRSVRECTAQR